MNSESILNEVNTSIALNLLSIFFELQLFYTHIYPIWRYFYARIQGVYALNKRISILKFSAKFRKLLDLIQNMVGSRQFLNT